MVTKLDYGKSTIKTVINNTINTITKEQELYAVTVAPVRPLEEELAHGMEVSLNGYMKM